MDNKTFSKENKCGLKPEDFKATIDEKAVDLFVLRNSNGLEICATNYGGIVMAIMAPDKDGNFANVVLGHDSIDTIVNGPEPYLGATIGRYGNRIANGKFTLHGKEYNLAINNGPNNLHGGIKGYNKVVWDAEQTDSQTLVLRYTSAYGEEGFPGLVKVVMTYTLTDKNEFIIDYKAAVDKKTYVNLTNHAFFNLAGISNPTPSVEDHKLVINADFYTPIDENSIPTGEILSVKDTAMDFRDGKLIGRDINEKDQQLINGTGYDHNYVLNKKEPEELSFAAEYTDLESKRTLKVFTTEPGMQLYTGNWLSGFEGIDGSTFPARSAVCFEAQHFPDTPNRHYFPSAIVNPGDHYTQTTVYEFGITE